MSYLDKDLSAIHNALEKGEVTPLDLINECQESIAKYNEDVNAFVHVIKEPKDETVTDNILSGIPYALKDNISTKGIVTTACSNTLKGYIPPYDATLYEKLNAKGAVLIGKTVMDELAMGGTGTTGNTGPTHNPYDLQRQAGGSSSGSAAAVALGIVPYAFGSDTGDSVRKPAAYCGVVGYKPSYGLISRYGLFAFASSLDHLGTFTRSVKDAALVVDEVKGYDPKDMTSIPDMDDISLYKAIDGNVKGKKLFYIKEICDKKVYENENTLKVLDNFYDMLEKVRALGIEVDEVSIDMNLLKAIKPIYDCISCAEVTSNNSNLTGLIFGPRGEGKNVYDVMKDHRTKGFSPLIKRRFVIGSYVLQKENQEKYFLNAKRVRRLICDTFNELFKTYDGFILPCSGDKAPLLTEDRNRITKTSPILENHLCIANFGGYPSISIPCGFIDKMPIGINITGAFKDDGNVLNIADAIESTLEYQNQVIKEVRK